MLIYQSFITYANREPPFTTVQIKNRLRTFWWLFFKIKKDRTVQYGPVFFGGGYNNILSGFTFHDALGGFFFSTKTVQILLHKVLRKSFYAWKTESNVSPFVRNVSRTEDIIPDG